MINPTRVATVVLGAMLWTTLFHGGFDLALAGPAGVSGETAVPLPAPQPTAELRGRAYLFRGAMGPFFSRGMDWLTERIEHAGVTASVYEFTICRSSPRKQFVDYRKDPAPIILIGHSMGGFCALKFSEILERGRHPR